MRSQDERNDAIFKLMEDKLFSRLQSLESDLCGHGDTEQGFYHGLAAAVEFLGFGAKALPFEGHGAALDRLSSFVASMLDEGEQPEGEQ